MKPSKNKTGGGGVEGKRRNEDISSDERVFSDDREEKRKRKKKNRDAKSPGEAANHTIEIENELAQMRQRVAPLRGQIDETSALLGEVLQVSADLEAALNDMKSRCAEREAREAALERALELAERAGQAGKEQIAEVHAVLSRERQQTAELSDTLAILQNRLAIEQEHNSALTVRAAAADASSTRERLQVESLDAILAATESKLADELTRAMQTEAELRAAHRRHGDLKRDLEAISGQSCRRTTSFVGFSCYRIHT